jgi:hypothetical protein
MKLRLELRFTDGTGMGVVHTLQRRRGGGGPADHSGAPVAGWKYHPRGAGVPDQGHRGGYNDLACFETASVDGRCGVGRPTVAAAFAGHDDSESRRSQPSALSERVYIYYFR